MGSEARYAADDQLEILVWVCRSYPLVLGAILNVSQLLRRNYTLCLQHNRHDGILGPEQYSWWPGIGKR